MSLSFDPRPFFGDQLGTEIAVLGLPDPFQLTLRAVPFHRAPEGHDLLEVYTRESRVARFVVPTEAVPQIEQLLAEPVHLVLLATDYDPGIQARMLAVVPGERARSLAVEEEPWKASLPEYEDDAPAPPQILPLGNIERTAEERKHPESLEKETADLFGTLLTSGGRERVDDILKDLGL